MNEEAVRLLLQIFQGLVRSEERNIFELNSSVGTPPLLETSLENARGNLNVLQSLVTKFATSPVPMEAITSKELDMVTTTIAYNIAEEEKEIAWLTGSESGQEFVAQCRRRIDLLREISSALGIGQ